jgi:hypothetical protein
MSDARWLYRTYKVGTLVFIEWPLFFMLKFKYVF